GADGMEDRRRDVAGGARQLGVALRRRTGLELLGRKPRQGRGRADAPGQPDAGDGDPAILLGGEIVGLDRRRLARVGAGDADGAAAGRPQIADGGGEGGEGVQLLAEALQGERLHVVLQVGRLARGVALDEGAELARRHAHRAAPEERVFEPDADTAEDAVGPLVERLGIADLVGEAHLQMVLQVLAHPRQRVTDGDAVTLQQLAGADSRDLQELRRADGAGGKDDLARGRREARLAVAPEFDPRRPPAAEADTARLGMRHHREVRPLHHRVEEAAGGAAPDAAALRYLEIAAALVAAAVEIVDLGDAG